jgi:MarR family transcriptional repressor of emrRAB
MNEKTAPLPPFSEVEEGIKRLAVHHPDLPKQEVLLTRLNYYIAKSLREVTNRLLKPFDLSDVSFSTLMMLFASPSSAINPSRLCDVTGESRTNMTRITDDLVARGLVERRPSPQDRRRVVLLLTPKAQALLKQLLPLLWEKQRAIYAKFSDAEKQSLEALLKKQLAAIEDLR